MTNDTEDHNVYLHQIDIESKSWSDIWMKYNYSTINRSEFWKLYEEHKRRCPLYVTPKKCSKIKWSLGLILNYIIKKFH